MTSDAFARLERYFGTKGRSSIVQLIARASLGFAFQANSGAAFAKEWVESFPASANYDFSADCIEVGKLTRDAFHYRLHSGSHAAGAY